jgi:hypothetical protein
MGIIALAAERNDQGHRHLRDLVREAGGSILVSELEKKFEAKFGFRPLLLTSREDIELLGALEHALNLEGNIVSLISSARFLYLVNTTTRH